MVCFRIILKPFKQITFDKSINRENTKQQVTNESEDKEKSLCLNPLCSEHTATPGGLFVSMLTQVQPLNGQSKSHVMKSGFEAQVQIWVAPESTTQLFNYNCD